MEFHHYRDEDYEAVCDFLIALNRADRRHINWNWARFEWMAEHPEFDKSARSAIGLWRSGGKVIAAAIYDMYFGEAFCGVLPGHEDLFPEVLDYAYAVLKNEGGLGIALCDTDAAAVRAAEERGFLPADQTETVLSRELDTPLPCALPKGYRIRELDPAKEITEFQWLLWQGFDHGTDRAVFEREDPIQGRARKHFNRKLSLAAVTPDGRDAAYCCLWYLDRTDYAYIEPVCTIPSCRGRGLAGALLGEAMKRASSMGAARAYVISDLDFYKKLGFREECHYAFYWKKG